MSCKAKNTIWPLTGKSADSGVSCSYLPATQAAYLSQWNGHSSQGMRDLIAGGREASTPHPPRRPTSPHTEVASNVLVFLSRLVEAPQIGEWRSHASTVATGAKKWLTWYRNEKEKDPRLATRRPQLYFYLSRGLVISGPFSLSSSLLRYPLPSG